MSDSSNKRRVEIYLDGFRTGDHEKILGCLTDDITWTVFGSYRVHGKKAYDAHIAEPGYSAPPDLRVVRLVEEGDVVMAELEGLARADDGTEHRLAMAEVFRLRDGLICERRAFVVPLTRNEYS